MAERPKVGYMVGELLRKSVSQVCSNDTSPNWRNGISRSDGRAFRNIYTKMISSFSCLSFPISRADSLDITPLPSQVEPMMAFGKLGLVSVMNSVAGPSETLGTEKFGR